MNDPISDFLVRVQNAGMAGKETAVLPYSKLKHEIATLLEKEGFVLSVQKKGKKVAKQLEVGIVYNGRKARIRGFRRISKPSRRLYYKVDDIRTVKNGYGRLILSTSKGVMSGNAAREAGIGGEALFIIW